MDGYNDGFDACSIGDRGGQSPSYEGYSVTVSIGKHPFGNQYSYVWIETENGQRDNARLATAVDPSVTFHIPPGYGDTVRICASSAPSTCVTRDAGADIRERLDVEGLYDQMDSGLNTCYCQKFVYVQCGESQKTAHLAMMGLKKKSEYVRS